MNFLPTSLALTLLQAAFFGIGLPLIGAVVSDFLMSEWRLAHEPFHSVIETVGGFLALAIVALMYVTKSSVEESTVRRIWIINAFITMGIFDIAHAMTSVGTSFVWFHTLATLFGGAIFRMYHIACIDQSTFKENADHCSNLKYRCCHILSFLSPNDTLLNFR